MAKQLDTQTEFSEEYGKILDVSRVKERAKRGYEDRLPESVLRCVWYDQLLYGDEFKTVDGRSLTVLSPGRWNFEAGPDFRNAVLHFDGADLVAGDVEIDTTVSDWRGHGHAKDANYAGVALLVVLRPPGRQAPPTNANGEKLPVLVLDDYLGKPLDQLNAEIDPKEYPYGKVSNFGACARAEKESTLCRIVDMAADWRVITKSKQFAKEIDEKGCEQAFYEGFMKALGYKKFKEEFQRVATRAGFEFLRGELVKRHEGERALLAEALLFHAAELVPDEAKTTNWDEDSREYYRGLKGLLAENRAYLPACSGEPIRWNIGGVRPTNFPMRRLAGAARVIAGTVQPGIARRSLDLWKEAAGTRRDVATFSELFTVAGEGYWGRHFTWGGKRTDKPVTLIGQARAKQIVVNLVIPFSLAVARKERNLSLERKVFSAYVSCPALPTNAIVRLMGYRLFGDERPPKAIIGSARRQQGLIQIYQDWCSDDPTCEQCSILPLVLA